MKPIFKVVLKNPDAVLPTFKKSGDAGMDLCSVEEKIIEPKSFCMVNTGLQFEIPNGYEIQIRPRSGLAAKHGVSVLNTPGTIDSGYRGEVQAILFNFSDVPFKVEKGMRICQMVVSKLDEFELKQVSKIDEDSDRSTGGFGSTGLK
ncbi:MAG: dUTP diphosphatase [Clostridia bacterium]|nr:dUTP diphosphatase [Clostridia bacterium]